jgi:hypothetical protein
MTSPLQVTILHFIVDTGGGVPTARWTLFNEYFEVLKKREKAKGGELQKSLERHWSHLGPIHHRAGLILQADSEHAGGAGSRFSEERFRGLVESYLTSEGFAGEDLEGRVKELTQLALNRMVLLSQQVEGSISFDVRSLQEFMAAAAITSGDQYVMERRLAHIAGISHWRHVFLIAASRCFADDGFHYRRAVILQIARQIDALEPDMVVRNGSRLALELLADGVALDHPHSRRPLLIHALEQLDLGVELFDDRLASVCDETTSDLVEIEAIRRIREGQPRSAICAWKLLFELARNGKKWAETLIVRHWPGDQTIQKAIIRNLKYPLGTARIVELVADTAAQLGPFIGVEGGMQFGHSLGASGRREDVDHSRLRRMNFGNFYSADLTEKRRAALPSALFGRSHFVTFVPLESSKQLEAYAHPDFQSAAWEPFRKSLAFAVDPTTIKLADAVRSFKKRKIHPSLRKLPWPLAAIVSEASDDAHLDEIANEIEQGLRGSAEDWKWAESRWTTIGLLERDFLSVSPKRFFDRNIANVGVPYWWPDYESSAGGFVEFARKLKVLAAAVENRQLSKKLIDAAAIAALSNAHGRGNWPREYVSELLELVEAADIGFPAMDVMTSIPQDMWVDKSVLRMVANRAALGMHYDMHPSFMRKVLLEGLQKYPDFEELVYPLVSATLADDRPEDSIITIKKIVAGASFEQPRSKAAIAAVELMDCDEHQIPSLLDKLRGDDQDDLMLATILLGGAKMPVEQRLKILSHLIKALRSEGTDKSSEFVQPMRKALDSRLSCLGTSEVWKRKLELPEESFPILLPTKQQMSIGCAE